MNDDAVTLDAPDPYTFEEYCELREDDPEAADHADLREIAASLGMTIEAFLAIDTTGSN